MKCQIVVLVAFLLSLPCLCEPAEVLASYQFGRDRMVFAGVAPMVQDESARPSASPALGKGTTVIEGMDALRFRQGVSVRYDSTGGPYVVSPGQIAPLSWRNAGRYVEPVQSRDQVVALLEVLHRDYAASWGRRVGPVGLAAILEVAKRPEWPFMVEEEASRVEADTLTRGLFQRDGMWLAHFLLIEEGASVVEYKYVIAPGNRIAGLRRVLVKGPPSPFLPGHVVRSLEPIPPKEREYTQCITFLLSHSLRHHPTDHPPPVEVGVQD